jgi:hypothetical protein
MRQPVPPSSRPAGLPEYRPAPAPSPIVAPISSASAGQPRRNEHGKKTVTVASYFDARGDHDQLPMIRLRGQWLQRIGFRAGERLIVTEEDGRIVLTLVRDEE